MKHKEKDMKQCFLRIQIIILKDTDKVNLICEPNFKLHKFA